MSPSILPESGKPIDLDQSRIVDQASADIVIAWLDALIADMQLQILQHLLSKNDNDEEWLGKVRSALRATTRTRFLVAEKRRDFMLQES